MSARTATALIIFCVRQLAICGGAAAKGPQLAELHFVLTLEPGIFFLYINANESSYARTAPGGMMKNLGDVPISSWCEKDGSLHVLPAPLLVGRIEQFSRRRRRPFDCLYEREKERVPLFCVLDARASTQGPAPQKWHAKTEPFALRAKWYATGTTRASRRLHNHTRTHLPWLAWRRRVCGRVAWSICAAIAGNCTFASEGILRGCMPAIIKDHSNAVMQIWTNESTCYIFWQESSQGGALKGFA